MTATIEAQDMKPKATKLLVALAEKEGSLTPQSVLEAARPKDSPLHGFFCWSNTKAAEKYREIQAAALIRRVKVTYHPTEERSVRVRAFVNVMPEPSSQEREEDPDAQTRGIYVSMETAVRFSDYADQMMTQCKRDAESFRKKYSALKEAAGIIREMEGFLSETAIV